MRNVSHLSPTLKVCMMLRKVSVFGKRSEILSLNILSRTKEVLGVLCYQSKISFKIQNIL